MDAATKDLLDTAWAVIANAGGGNWTTEPKDWREAAEKWRDRYFDAIRPSDDPVQRPGRPWWRRLLARFGF